MRARRVTAAASMHAHTFAARARPAQERIVTIGFGANKEIFNHSIFLVLCNRLVTCALAVLYLLVSRASVLPAAPLRSYAAVSLTNVIATSCQYEALYYVSFAVQTLAKSAKALPVMLWGTVFNAKKYRPADYVHALVITAGCTVFLMTGDASSRTVDDKADPMNYAIGSGLMLLYLGVDGLTSTWQDAMFSGYSVGVCDQVRRGATHITTQAVAPCTCMHACTLMGGGGQACMHGLRCRLGSATPPPKTWRRGVGHGVLLPPAYDR